MKTYLAELIGTYVLIFLGTGAIIINDLTPISIGHLGISLSFGIAVTSMIYLFRSVSGAHINPAVSIAFVFAGGFKSSDLFGYILAQISGAILASLSLYVLFDGHKNLGATIPANSVLQSFILELILSFVLMLVILFISQSPTVERYTAIAVGATVAIEAFLGGPISGASMNPARSIGPALISGHFEHLWIYIVSPCFGMILASFTWRFYSKRPKTSDANKSHQSNLVNR